MAAPYSMLINGELVNGSASFPVVNPSTAQELGQAPHASEAETDAAVMAAFKAFPKWAATPIEERQAAMKKGIEVLKAALPDLISLLVKEQGKPVGGATGEMQYTLMIMDKAANLKVPIEVYSDTPEYRTEVRRKPVGVVVGITPWNFPVFCSAQKWAAALVLGNTFILKPSPYTPLTNLAIGKLLKDVFPPGVFNVITGADNAGFNVGVHLVNHPKVRKISFTGSGPTGQKIMAACSNDMKRVTLELGGNDPAIVRSDCDVKETAPKVFAGAMGNTGQVCCAIKRVFVHESIFDGFCAELAECAKKAKVGDGFEEGVEFGPLNNKMQFDKVSELVEDAKKNGAKILAGGNPDTTKPGFFYPPTIIADVKEGFRIVDEEQFGPVMPVMKYSDDEEALERANDTVYGLGGSVWSKDIATANRLADRIQSGTVWVNEHMALTGAPFGGFKSSGLGRELGRADIDCFTECQTLKLAK
eukprot:NODE_1791_length_1608_cov_129.851852_g1705_i0.p1 GENE.NODE_1791_length_1608_cov_129.851852_g1705_i0~~NODE_1791_length_1608_cov_129.851852_g1705_i0.p1  ORF type:complete len:493 (+),score=153.83 NODE_1791_length_1608_cov_129.851852_g1705_i0:60-1481(+)